jgi:hypothetical protein
MQFNTNKTHCCIQIVHCSAANIDPDGMQNDLGQLGVRLEQGTKPPKDLYEHNGQRQDQHTHIAISRDRGRLSCSPPVPRDKKVEISEGVNGTTLADPAGVAGESVPSGADFSAFNSSVNHAYRPIELMQEIHTSWATDHTAVKTTQTRQVAS